MKKKLLDDTITSFENDSNIMIKSYKYTADEEKKDSLNEIFSKVKDKNKLKTEESPVPLNERMERFKLDEEVIHTFTKTIEKDIELKKSYAEKLISIFFLQLVLFNVIFILCGFGILKYSDFTLQLFTGATIVELVTMISIVVKYLFQDNISKTLKDILEKNKIDK